MAETRIKESLRYRQVGGGFLIFLGLVVTLFTVRFMLPHISSIREMVVLLPGPCMLLLGAWAAFPRRTAALRMVITNNIIEMKSPLGKATVIQLSDLKSISITRPLLAKHDRLTFLVGEEEEVFDVVQLTQEARDIIHLISVRLENQGKFLEQGLSAVLGAGTGVWHVHAGNPFSAKEDRAKIGHA